MKHTGIWEKLMVGNKNFSKGLGLGETKPDKLVHLRQNLANHGQKPFAAILTCSDSRVAPEILFQTHIGDIFVVRVAGNIASEEVIGSLEFAVTSLGVKLIVVLGHTKCAKLKLGTAIKTHVIENADRVQQESTCINEAIKAGKIDFVAAIYDIHTGLVRKVDY